MEFSIIHFPRSWDAAQDEYVIDAIVEQSLAADALGFKGVFFPEHHFHGYSPSGSAPFQIASYVAPQLKQAWLGMAVVVVPLHHPVHLVEQMNLLDHLAKGKVLYGVGSGIHAEEGVGFGLDYDYQIKSMTTENLEIAEKLWEHTPGDAPYHFETPNYSGWLFERIVPAPYRKKRPNIMGVASRDSSITRAARNGWPVFVSGFMGRERFIASLRKYRHELAAAGHAPSVLKHCMEWTTETFQGLFVAETDEQAFKDMCATMEGHERFRLRQLPFMQEAERIGGVSQANLRVRPPATDPSYYTRWCLWGSPDTIAKKMQTLADVGLGNVLMSFNNGLYDDERKKLTERSMQLFVKEVMPRFTAQKTPSDPLAIDLGGTPPSEKPAAAPAERVGYD
jgi:alkanesulfonate monooxygenase SsuD/methylene tetrahydromethanopterin reductase-like flavin-dependent oxidoreductase (luciferase family)